MKQGDIIVCIDNTGWESELTYGRQYKVVMYNCAKRSRYSSKLSSVTILDDLGKVFRYNDERFITLSKFRSSKLNELGI
jgi:hypothetical protein